LLPSVSIKPIDTGAMNVNRVCPNPKSTIRQLLRSSKSHGVASDERRYHDQGSVPENKEEKGEYYRLEISNRDFARTTGQTR
jgi:hypothetical protein